MPDTTAPILAGLDLPAQFDVSAGAQSQRVTAWARDPGGEGVSQVAVYFDREIYLQDHLWLGLTRRLNVDGLFSGDRFGDTTPETATRNLPLTSLTRSGEYTVTKVAVTDQAGNRAVYSKAELQAMGINTTVTVKGGVDDALAPTLLALALPSTLDLATGRTALGLSGRLVDNVGGTGVGRMAIEFDRPLSFEYGSSKVVNVGFTPGAVAPGQALSFTDSGNVLTGATAPGSYQVTRVTVYDLAGNAAVYSAAQLQTLGIGTTFDITGSTQQPGATLTDVVLEDGFALALTSSAWTGGEDSFRLVISYDPTESRFNGASFGTGAGHQLAATVTENGRVGTVTITGSGSYAPGAVLRVEMQQLKENEYSLYDVKEFAVNGLAQRFAEEYPHRSVISGSSSDDVLRADAQLIDGGDGFDSVDTGVFLKDASIARDGERIIVSLPGGRELSVENVERLVFVEDVVEFAPEGVAAQTWRLYRAAFDRAPDMDGLGYWISQVEHGLSREQLAGALMASSEFGPQRGTEAFVTLLYQNVLDRAPDAAGHAYWTAAIEQQGLSREQAMIDFADSAEHVARIVGETADGIAYTVW